MYAPLSDALNHGLEALSEIEVVGLPKFQNHIVFVPLDERVRSNRGLEGSSFKPDIVLMSLVTACDFRKIKNAETLQVSQFVSKIPKKVSKMAPPRTTAKAPSKNVPPQNNTPKAPPSDRICWKDILSAVELKRGRNTQWPALGNFTDTIPAITHEDSDEALLGSQNPDPETPSDISTSQTCRIHTPVDE